MENQVVWRVLGKCVAAIACLAWAGCASVKREAAPAGSGAPAGTNGVAAAATTNVPPAGGYDWDTLARMAAANSSEAQALLLEAQAERHQAAVDAGWRNPQLRVGQSWGDEDEVTPGRTGMRTYPDEVGRPSRPFTSYRKTEEQSYDGESVGLRVYTVNPFVNRWLRRRGEAAAKALEKKSEEEAYAVFCEVRSLCLEAELLREEIALLEQMAEVRVQLRDVRREESEAGEASPLDLIRSETRVASLGSELCEKRTARQQLVRRIAVLAGVPAEQVKLRPRGATSPVAPTLLEPAVLTDMAFMRRPDLARAEHEKEAAAHGVKAAKAGEIPWFEFVEGTYKDENADTYSQEQYYSGSDYTARDQTEWQVRLAVTLPVFTWLGDEVNVTRAKLAAAEARVRGLYDVVRTEVGGVLEDYRVARGERDRLMGECERVCATMKSRIDALAQEPTVKREEVLAAREELIAYRRVCLKSERECLRMEQYLETVSGGSLAQKR